MFTTTTAGRSSSSARNAPSSPRSVCERQRPRVGPVAAVQHVQEQRRALDVRQEAVPEAGALAGPLDEAGDVGDDRRPLTEIQHAQVGVDRGERIGRDLGVRPRQRGEQRRLARVGQPDQADVGEQLEREREPELVALQTLLGELGRLAGRTLEADVAAPALAAAGDEQALALAHEVAEELALGVADLGADRHLDEQFGPVGAALVGAAPVAAVDGAEVVLVAEVREVVQLARRDQHDVAAGRAVPSVGPALGHVLLTAEAHGAAAAVTSAHADACPVEHVKNEAGERRPLLSPRGRPR